MKIKKYCILFLLGVSFFNINMAQNHQQNKGKPNVIIIFIDDEGYGDVGCYGATGFETPNLDKIASKGMRFTNFSSACMECFSCRTFNRLLP